MDFRLSDEQMMLAEAVGSAVLDPRTLDRRRQVIDNGDMLDRQLWASVAEMGLFAMMVHERFGGTGASLLDVAVVAEQLGRGATAIPFETHLLATMAIESCSDEVLRQRWLPRLVAGDTIATLAFAETFGWDPADWSTIFDHGLHGKKRSVVAGPVADLLVVAASDGLHLVEVANVTLDWQPLDAIDRTRRHGDVRLDSTPATPLPDADIDAVIDAALVLQAADAFGAATELISQTVDYCKQRHQFGRPIAGFQAVKHQLADMATAVAMSRGLWWYGAHAFEAIPSVRRRAAALAKAHVTDQAWHSGRAAIEAQGGIAFTWEADAHIYYKRIQSDRQMFGPPVEHFRRFADLEGW